VKPKRTLGIGLAIATALLGSACAAGQQAQTAYERSTQNGTDADVGSIHIRGMVIDAPVLSYKKGDSATVKVVFVNAGQAKSDLLESISSPAISDWSTYNSPAAADAVLTAGKAGGRKSKATPDHQVLIPPGGRVSFGTPDSTGALVFLHFTRPVYPGTTIPVTLRFAQAGSISVFVPVALTGAPGGATIPAPAGSSIEG
jgi:copper(I)-binding protein